MKPELDRELKIYLKQIKTLMPFCGKEEKSFIQDLRQNIEDYIEAHPGCTWDEVAEQFETPQEVVFGYLCTLEPEKIRKKISIKKYISFTIFIICVLFAIYFFTVSYMFYDVVREIQEQTIIEHPTIIIE